MKSNLTRCMVTDGSSCDVWWPTSPPRQNINTHESRQNINTHGKTLILTSHGKTLILTSHGKTLILTSHGKTLILTSHGKTLILTAEVYLRKWLFIRILDQGSEGCGFDSRLELRNIFWVCESLSSQKVFLFIYRGYYTWWHEDMIFYLLVVETIFYE